MKPKIIILNFVKVENSFYKLIIAIFLALHKMPVERLESQEGKISVILFVFYFNVSKTDTFTRRHQEYSAKHKQVQAHCKYTEGGDNTRKSSSKNLQSS